MPDYLVGEPDTVKLYLKELKVVRNGQVVATHPRLEIRNRYQVQMIQYVYTLKRKPGAIEHSLVLTKLPQLRRCFTQFYKQEPKLFIELAERKQHLPMDKLVDYLDKQAVKHHKTFSTKVVNEARNQLKEYNRIHQVKEVIRV